MFHGTRDEILGIISAHVSDGILEILENMAEGLFS